MPQLVLVRHGQSVWNLENRFTGWVDVDLTPQGEAEARAAGQRLKDEGFAFEQAFTSALKRAQRTLGLILEELGTPDLPTTQDQRLNERDYGDLAGLNKAETAQQYGDDQVRIWRRSFDIAPPGGESLQDTANRVIPYYQDAIVPALKRGQNVLVVAHGNSLRALVMNVEGLDAQAITAVEMPTGTPKIYNLAPETLAVIDSRWLAAEANA